MKKRGPKSPLPRAGFVPPAFASEARWRDERAVQDAPPSFQAEQESAAQKEGQGRGAVKARSERLGFAKELRQQQTKAEQRLWYHLRAHRFQGLKFLRQKPIGPYIADFVCYERKLIVEVDGGQHNQQTLETDRVRDEWLKAKGFNVLRFWNNDVLTNTEAVLESIRLMAELHGPSPPTPLPQAGEGSGPGAP